ncbi:MAG: hypothetical protein J7L88_06540 [Thermoplasmata archaeon]|nr:hypothetical protein [Thermoplasmata archaeon]
MALPFKLTKNMIVLLVVIGIIVASIMVVLLWGRGEIKDIHMSKPLHTDFDADGVNDGISFSVFATAPGVQKVSGGGKYTIYYQGNKVYSGDFKFIEGRDTAEVKVRYERFVEGNGQYTVEVSAGGRKTSDTVNVGFVVEALNSSVSVVYDGSSYKIRVLVIPVKEDGSNLQDTPIKSSVRFTVKDPRGNPEIYTVEKRSFPGGVYVSHNFNITEKGNYTFKIEWTNGAVMESSQWKSVESFRKQYIDRPPKAVLNVPSHISLGADLSETVTLDGSSSTDDGTITMYSFSVVGPGTDWSYWESQGMESDGEDNDKDGETDEAGEAPDAQFDGKTTFTFTAPGEYTITLYVQDDNPYFPGGNTTAVSVEVTVR